jgi:RNA methyltransferase, TrmH family
LRLTTRKGRRDAGRFLAEGPQAVIAALQRQGAQPSPIVLELFATESALATSQQLAHLAARNDVEIDLISPKAAAALSETVTPQGVVAVCRYVDQSLDTVLARVPRLIAVLIDTNDPGNAGTIVRTADAAGADAVIFAGGVDPYNGKVVRASAGSLFQVGLVAGVEVGDVLAGVRAAGLTSLATTGTGECDIEALAKNGTLARPTAWLFGSEAHGLPADVLAAADERVYVPIYGRAESLNLAVAAGICLYASAREQRRLGMPA